MRAAARLVLIGAFGGVALGACGQDAGTEVSNDEHPIEIETLPPDESTAAPNDEILVNDEVPANTVTVIKGDEPHH